MHPELVQYDHEFFIASDARKKKKTDKVGHSMTIKV
jgi:hypothetical protein